MLHLDVFGGVSIVRSTGEPLGSAAAQRRVLALLALAAGSGPKGLSRERAMAVLWPEADSDRARHALSQTMYHTRNACHAPELFAPGTELRLNAAVISSDVWQFERLLKAGDDAGAVGLYRGPFLDGFSLPGSTEFEEWASGQRRHFETLVTAALERLGSAAEGKGDWAAAVSWRQRLASLDITSSRATLKLMEALVKAGDSASALRHADVHRRAVRALLESEPDESITALETEIRTARAPAASVKRPEPAAAVASAPVAPAVPDAAPANVAEPSAPVAVPALSARRSRAWLLVPLAAAAGVAWLVSNPGAADPPHARVAVEPFRVTGADPSLAYLGEGIVDLLGARFQDDAATSGLIVGSVVGSVVGTEERVYLSATLTDPSTGRRDRQVSAEGSVDSLGFVIDNLAARILAERYGEADRLATGTTPSLVALRSYLSGQDAYRRGEYQLAARQFETALRADSQFALAALQLAMSSNRINDGEQHSRALAIAWNRRHELVPRDRAQLVALAGPNYPQPSTTSEAVAAMTSAVNLRPLRPEMWYEFGQRLLRDGGHLAMDDVTRRAVSAFARALELDPTDRLGARAMLIVAAARLRDTATMLRYASPAAISDSMRALGPFVQWTIARVRGDTSELEELRAEFSELDAENLRLISMSSLYDDAFKADGELAANLLAQRTIGSRGLDALLAQHAFALSSGDTSRAVRITDRIKERFPGMHAHLRLRMLDGMYGGGSQAAALAAAAEIERSTARRVPTAEFDKAVYFADLCVLEQWRLHHGSRENTRSTIERLRASGFPRVQIAISTNPHACATLLQTWLAVETTRRDARKRLLALDSLLLDGPAVGDAARYAHILVARLHVRLNDRRAALAALKRRGYLAGWPRYSQTVAAEEAGLRRALGTRQGF